MTVADCVKALALGLVLAGTAACSEAGGDAHSAEGPSVDPNIYGADGYETVNGIDFVSAQVMFDRYSKGEVACWDFNFDDNSCTSAIYSTMVRQGVLDLVRYRINPEYTIKMVYPIRLELKGKFLCATFNEETIQSWTANYARDNVPKSSAGEYSVEPENLVAWRDSNIRSSGATLGVERCYRYSQVMENGQAVPGAYHVYEFIDGMMQPQPELAVMSMFAGSALEDLRLRPD